MMLDIDVIEILRVKLNEVQTEKKFDSIDRNQKVSSLGLDSLLIMEVLGDIQDELDISLPENKITQIQMVSDLESLIIEALKA